MKIRLKCRDQKSISAFKKNASSQLLQILGHGSSHWFTLASTLTKTQLNMKYGI